jgi:hypothetical protein
MYGSIEGNFTMPMSMFLTLNHQNRPVSCAWDGAVGRAWFHLDRSSRVSRMNDVRIDRGKLHDTDGHFFITQSSLAEVEFTKRLQMRHGMAL